VTHGQGIEWRTRLWRWLRTNPVTHWCVLSVVLAATVSMHDNNANPYARFAMLAAIAEDHSFAMDAYRDTTCDWARTPDGHYYSNKAPGPALLATPLFLAIDAVVVGDAKDRAARDVRRMSARNDVLDILALVLQSIPFALVVMLAADRLVAMGASRAAVELAALAMLFGNSAALLMNMFYGHGMAALFTLALALALLDRRWAVAGLLFGLDVLTDYGSALFFPILLGILLAQQPRGGHATRSRLWRFALGGLAPLLVFMAYHQHCFGGPFTLPNKYQNPVFVETGGHALWGVIDFFPSAERTYQLLVGPKRSLLVTQPWVLLLGLLIARDLWRRRRWSTPRWPAAATVLPLAFGGLVLLFAMNASFGGWHGGVSPGPRYLSAALPVVGLALGLCYDLLPRTARVTLWLLLLPSLVLFVVVWSSDVAIWPQHEIWHRCWDVLARRMSDKTLGRLLWILAAFAATSGVAAIRAQLARRSRFAPPT
jgi:hypothetical protein